MRAIGLKRWNAPLSAGGLIAVSAGASWAAMAILAGAGGAGPGALASLVLLMGRAEGELVRIGCLLGVLAVVLAVAVIGALYLAQASRTAAAGRRLQAMEQQRQALEQENEQLRAEIAALRSVPRLTGAAESLGYHPAGPGEVEYMLVKNVPPLAEPTPAPDLTTSEIEPTYNETLECMLAEQLSTFRR